MAATIKLYDPQGLTGSTFYAVPVGTASDALINLNILIELRVMNQYLAAMTQGIVTDTIENLRSDVVSEGAN